MEQRSETLLQESRTRALAYNKLLLPKLGTELEDMLSHSPIAPWALQFTELENKISSKSQREQQLEQRLAMLEVRARRGGWEPWMKGSGG